MEHQPHSLQFDSNMRRIQIPFNQADITGRGGMRFYEENQTNVIFIR